MVDSALIFSLVIVDFSSLRFRFLISNNHRHYANKQCRRQIAARTLLERAVNFGLERPLGQKAGMLTHNVPILKKQQRRDTRNAVLRRHFRACFDVKLAYYHTALVFGGDGFDDRAKHFARAAPFGPKIHYYREAAGQDLFGEILIGKFFYGIGHIFILKLK
jgi:hypothetical protein